MQQKENPTHLTVHIV